MTAHKSISKLLEGKSTLLLDMDGTLLDLSFDDTFWSKDLPTALANKNDQALDEVVATVSERLKRDEGTLNWYSPDYWSEVFDIDIMELTRSMAHGIRFLPGAGDFLDKAVQAGLRCILLTNAHPNTLVVKNQRTAILDRVDSAYSSYDIGFAKEDRRFWQRLAGDYQFDFDSAIMIDDSLAVLATAADFVDVLAVSQPVPAKPARDMRPFPTIRTVADINFSVSA